ncbi:MAG TPA: septum formation initiator family protein [Candidatus Kapabacteria bacterium]|nr:septum formation initiator family protein [Candidatus Kapabacteria bacterium]
MQNNENQNITPKRSKKRKILYLLIIALMLYFLIFDNYGIIKRFSLENQNEEKRAMIYNEIKLKDSLNREIFLMEYDTNTIEKIAREKYGMIKPNEKVIILK